MRKCILTFGIALLMSNVVLAQDSTIQKQSKKKPKTDWSKVQIGERANDHFMFQFGYDGWVGTPDSIRTTGIGRHLNVYLMLDKPFKTDPRLSVGLGVGIGSSSIFLDKMLVDLKGEVNPTQVTFIDASESERFRRYKLNPVWVEAPIELRYVANPLNSNKSFKWALGIKIGTMIDAKTKGKDFQDEEGQSLFGNKYTMKEKDRKFLNNLRLAPTARIGYGNFTVYGAYQLTSLFREGQGPSVRPFSIGLCLSGL